MNDKTWPNRGYAAFLFDMDGTILNSIRVTERVWSEWAKRHGIDSAQFLQSMHGVRATELISKHVPTHLVEVEFDWVYQAEMAGIGDVVPIEGAADFLRGLPAGQWAVVTSAQREMALARLKFVGLPLPELLITAEDVANGKPAPDCFLLAAERLGVAATDCLVFEDAPAGISAAETAGAGIIVVSAAHKSPVKTSHPMINNFTGLHSQIDEYGQLWLRE